MFLESLNIHLIVLYSKHYTKDPEYTKHKDDKKLSFFLSGF